MSSIRDLLDKLEEIDSKPSVGDGFFLELGENIEIETEILEINENGDVILLADSKLISILEDLESFEKQKLTESGIINTLGSLLGFFGKGAGAVVSPIQDANPAGEFSDLSLKSKAYWFAKDRGESDSSAKAFADEINNLGPSSSEAKQVLDYHKGQFSNSQAQLKIDNLSKKAQNYISDTTAAAKLATQNTFKSAEEIANNVQIAVGKNLPPDVISKIAQYAKEYALPGAAIVALLYGGKKLYDYLTSSDKIATTVSEAEYQGRKVPLGKPMRGDVKKFKVYVRNPSTGNIKKVNFGDKTMRIKKSNPKRRKSFRARHNCANPGPRTKARYWSCRKW